ncbi:MAG: cytochrome-c peroxidase [Saprospiraceae bacterium]|nr:cytochrome-c peroxidase [Saprospiraceae bacterium]
MRQLIRLIAFGLWFVTLYVGCQDQELAQSVDQNSGSPAVRVRFTALPETVINPADNPASAIKTQLGRLLFYDPILSGDKDVACATCHHPASGYAESLPISIGVNGQGFGANRVFKQPNVIPFTKRNSQSILNTAFNGIDIYGDYRPEEAPMFWDLRALSLEKQALEPIKAMEEMRGKNFSEHEILDEVIQRIRNIPEYERRFSEAFPGDSDPISNENLAKAIAAFERTLLANNTRFDQYMRGNQGALSESEIEGFEAFKEAGCGNCHNGPMFSDFKTHVISVPPTEKLTQPDSGFQTTFAFRTPSLRNLRFSFPFMHNGELESLKEILEFYEDIAGGKSRSFHVTKEQLDPFVKELKVEVKKMGQIINFLLCLNDDDFDKTIPESVPSGLPVGGNIAE